MMTKKNSKRTVFRDVLDIQISHFIKVVTRTKKKEIFQLDLQEVSKLLQKLASKKQEKQKTSTLLDFNTEENAGVERPLENIKRYLRKNAT